jgi:hypothetical protein
VKLRRIVLALALWASGFPPGHTAPAVDLQTRVVLKIEGLAIEGDHASTVGVPREVELVPSVPAEVDFDVPWGTAPQKVSVHFSARLTSVTPGGEAVLICESSTTGQGRPPVVASREIRLADEGSGLFEVFGDGQRRLVLTLHGEQVRRAVVRPPTTVGAPVKFTIAVERVEGERTALLETNELHTFVGQSVEYSFRQGQNDGLETVRLSVLPVAISGDVITIEAEISGALPGAGGTTLVSHAERIVASRRATSRLAATTGAPPMGYQFQETPDF